MKVAVTGLNVPGVKAGIFTTAFVGVPTTVKDCNPVPAFYQNISSEKENMLIIKTVKCPKQKHFSVSLKSSSFEYLLK